MASKKQLEARARRIAAKFVEDAQAIFDDPGMNDSIYDGEGMEALVQAQQACEDVVELLS